MRQKEELWLPNLSPDDSRKDLSRAAFGRLQKSRYAFELGLEKAVSDFDYKIAVGLPMAQASIERRQAALDFLRTLLRADWEEYAALEHLSITEVVTFVRDHMAYYFLRHLFPYFTSTKSDENDLWLEIAGWRFDYISSSAEVEPRSTGQTGRPLAMREIDGQSVTRLRGQVSKKAFASLCGISEDTLKKAEDGRATLKTLENVCRYLATQGKSIDANSLVNPKKPK